MMFSAMRKRIRFSPASVIAGLALVFAMTGGAYAAKKYLITSTKQISPSVLRSLQGKAGAPGAAGAQGAQGPAGPAGPQGPAGSSGSQGERGPQGEKGTTGSQGLQGKAGATGATGTTGFTPTLPSGKTEMGYWSYAGVLTSESPIGAGASISFTIPLAAPSTHVVFLSQAETEGSVHSGKCEYEPENPQSKPVAPSDTLCVFTTVEEAGSVAGIGGFGEDLDTPAGTFLLIAGEGAENQPKHASLHGVWAVTAP